MPYHKQFIVTVTLACALWAQAAWAQFTVTNGAGKSVLVVTKSSTKYDVSNGSSTIGSLKLESGRINLYDTRGNKVGSVKKSGSDFALDDAAGKKVAKVSSREGGWRVKDAADKTLIKIKPRDDGFKVGDEAGNSLAKGKKKGETIELSTESGAVILKVSGKVRADVTGVLIVKQFNDLQKAAIILAVSQL